MSIQPLPEHVVAQINSSAAITSLNEVVLELFKNSLDAGSTKVDIRVDYSRGGCVVEDNGLGILPSEFGPNGGLGKLHHSSKLDSQTLVHGGRGTFLASLGALCLLTITSHHHEHRSHNAVIMHKSEVVSRHVPAPAHQCLSHSAHGTRVAVRDLFGNMPVRVKQRAAISEKQGLSKDWENLKRGVVLLCLAWPDRVAITLRDLLTNQIMIVRGVPKIGLRTEASRVCAILSQTSFIVPEEKASWVSIGASTSSLDISGTISLVPSPSKHVQFISFNIYPVLALEGQTILHDEINRLFLNSAFGNEEVIGELDDLERSRREKDARYKSDGYTNKELKRRKKGVDRWPMFYLNLQRISSSTVCRGLDVDEFLDDKLNSLGAVIKLVQTMMYEFLEKYDFRPKAPRSRNSTDVGDMNTNGKHLRQLRDCKFARSSRPSSVKGDSPRPSTEVDKKESIKIRNVNPDLLGINVQLPSFRRSSSKSDSPFDAWSRIKSGTTKLAPHNDSDVSISLEICRPSTIPPLLSSPVSVSKLLQPSLPLISSTGKITPRPFEDVLVDLPRSRSAPYPIRTSQSSLSTPAKLQPPPMAIDLTGDDDDVVAWTNPITKIESIVNKRTGHTVSCINNKAVTITRSSSNLNFSSRLKMHSDVSSTSLKPSPWLATVLDGWENPIFQRTEPSIPQLSLAGEVEYVLHGHRHNCTQLDIRRAFSEVSSGIQGRISKQALRKAEIIGQVDKKFILVKLSNPGRKAEEEKTLVIIDQHAADERIRVENLLAELCTTPASRPGQKPSESGVCTVYLDRSIVVEVSETDIDLLGRKQAQFAKWGICYDLPVMEKNLAAQEAAREAGSKKKLAVRSLPSAIVERCKSDPKLLLDLIRTELYSSSKKSQSRTKSPNDASEVDGKSWLKQIHSCPQGIIDMLNSRACRSAIMFNDVLSTEQCEVLLSMLAGTAFPFQCAHGRPTLLPLVELGSLAWNLESVRRSEQAGGGFGRDFRKWRLNASNQ